MSRDKRTPWHERLGKALADAQIGLPCRVSSEEELALRSQRLQVARGAVDKDQNGHSARFVELIEQAMALH